MVRPAYSGDKRTLALAFDIGTTFSGISYVLLDPDQVPEIKSVTRCASPLISETMGMFPLKASLRFPGQTVTSSKIPSTIWYDSSGRARSFGAEATLLDTVDKAETNGWTKLDW